MAKAQMTEERDMSMSTRRSDNVAGLIGMAEANRKEEVLKPEKEQKAWRRLVDNWVTTLPKSDRRMAKTNLYAFLECWGKLPEKQRYRPYGFRQHNSPQNRGIDAAR